MFKRAKIVMLPTNKKARMCKIIDLEDKTDTIVLQPNDDTFINEKSKYFHIEPFNLYITSDDEIKEGDWVYADFYGEKQINKAFLYRGDLLISIAGCGETSINNFDKKIIATTDSSLWKHDDTVPYPKTKPALPQPSQAFIEKYVEEYNKGNIITDVLVEYEFDTPYYKIVKNEDKGVEVYPSIIKVNSKDNTITIKKVKDIWNRQEVIELLYKHTDFMLSGKKKLLSEWIEENL